MLLTLLIHFDYPDAPDVFQVPTLDSLQPNLDEFMEHFESFTGKTSNRIRYNLIARFRVGNLPISLPWFSLD